VSLEEGSKIKPYQLNWKAVEAFRYRVEGEIHALTATAVQSARVAEIKMEMLNSEKLQVRDCSGDSTGIDSHTITVQTLLVLQPNLC
jgi:hypothetical protein